MITYPQVLNTLSSLSFASLFAFSASAQAGNLECKTVAQKISKTSETYQRIENLAELQVYYGTIEGFKTSPVLNLYRTQACTENGMKGDVFRFQTLAKPTPRSKERLFYCYAKIVSPQAHLFFNYGTHCSTSNDQEIASSGFPYNQSSDPYSTDSSHQRNERSPDYNHLENEFNHALNRGLDQGFDPFFDSDQRNTDGPDSIEGSPL